MPTIIQTSLSNEQLMQQNYVAILEKTNQQLGLWSNPYGVIISILTLLIAILAIGVSVYLWWNSREQRKEREEQTKAFFSGLNELANKNIEEAKKHYDELISAQEKILASSKANKKELEKELNELKKERANIGTSIGTAVWGGTTNPLTISTSSNSVGASSLWTNGGTVTGPTGPFYAKTTGYGISGTGYTGNDSVASLFGLCPKCKNSYNYGQKFCAICGTKL